MATQTGSQAVERASALLSLIVESGTPRTFSSLVDELGLAKSTTSRLLQALERSRLVHRDRAGAFRPGALFSLHAARPSALHDLCRARPARPWSTCRSCRAETVNLAVPRGGQLVQIDQVDSRYLIGATNWVGVDVPAHCTALGKVLYAFGALPVPPGQPGAAHRALAGRPRPVRPRPRRGAPPRLGRVAGRAGAGARPRSAPRSGPSTARSSPPSRSPDRPAASTTTASPRSAISWSPSSAACPRCWVINRAINRASTGTEGRLGMTDHAEILRGLYDETLVGNKPRVLELTHEGLASGLDPGVDAVRRADPVAGGGRRPLRARRLLRARDAGRGQGDERRAGHPAPAAGRDRRADRRHVPDEHGQGRRARHRQEPGEHHVGGRGLPRDRPRGAGVAGEGDRRDPRAQARTSSASPRS